MRLSLLSTNNFSLKTLLIHSKLRKIWWVLINKTLRVECCTFSLSATHFGQCVDHLVPMCRTSPFGECDALRIILINDKCYQDSVRSELSVTFTAFTLLPSMTQVLIVVPSTKSWAHQSLIQFVNQYYNISAPNLWKIVCKAALLMQGLTEEMELHGLLGLDVWMEILLGFTLILKMIHFCIGMRVERL